MLLDFAVKGLVKSQFRIEKMDKLTEMSGKLRNQEILMIVGNGVIKDPIYNFSLCRFFKT